MRVGLTPERVGEEVQVLGAGPGQRMVAGEGDEEFVGTTMGFWEEMSGKGSQVQTKVLAQDLAEASERERAALRLDEHAQVVRLRRPPSGAGGCA